MGQVGRPLKIIWQDELAVIYQVYIEAKSVENRRFLQALWLLRQGQTIQSVCGQVGVCFRQVQRYVRLYQSTGLYAYVHRRQGGRRKRQPKLSAEAGGKLIDESRHARFRTIFDVASWLTDLAVCYKTFAGLRKACYRIGLRFKCTRPIHIKKPVILGDLWKNGGLFAARIAPFYQNYYFFDEIRIGLKGQTRRVWAPRGKTIVQQVQHTYKWAYLALAVNPQTGEFIWQWIENMKGQTLADLLAAWHSKSVQTIVWDRAPSHQSKVVINSQTNLIQLPPYSPELNPVERVFCEIRRKIEGVVYETIQDKKNAVEAYLDALNKKQIQKLTYWQWIQQANHKAKVYDF